MTEVSSSLDSEAISSLNELAAVLHVLAVIKHGEFTCIEFEFFWSFKKKKSRSDKLFYVTLFKNSSAGQSKAGLKSAATSVQQQLHKHAVTSVDSGDIQR